MRKARRNSLPRVSVIIPMKNEEQYIARCLESVVSQDYPKALMEVLVIDGMSQDSSRKIVAHIAKEYSFIELLHNPNQATVSALNMGINHSKGQIIIRVDAHCLISPDYIRCCVNRLQETGADNVGGFVLPVGIGFWQRAIGHGMGSLFGIGCGRFNYREKDTFVDTVSFGAYRREVFENIGLYDDKADCGEDDELNYRLVKSGGKIVLSSRIKSRYYPRSSLSALWKQYYGYGRGKVRTITKHGRPASWRHLVPAIFVLSLLGSLLLIAVNQSFGWLIAGICGVYLISAILVSAKICFREGWKYFAVLPIVFATIHLSYGIGFLGGTFRFCFRLQRKAEDAKGR